MKMSVSLPEEDVAFLDAYAAERGIVSRSAALQRAIQMLRTSGLGAEYAEAWEEWAESGDAAAWDGTVGDGLGKKA
jgi:Arc/MetJ-type ribon-helix-helix transcriptional regulator